MYVTNPHFLSRNRKFCELFNMQWLYYLQYISEQRKESIIMSLLRLKGLNRLKAWKIIRNF